MKIVYMGSQSIIEIPGVGEVARDMEIDVPAEIGRALILQDGDSWKAATKASRTDKAKGGGD